MIINLDKADSDNLHAEYIYDLRVTRRHFQDFSSTYRI